MNRKQHLLFLVVFMGFIFPIVHSKQVTKRSIPRFGEYEKPVPPAVQLQNKLKKKIPASTIEGVKQPIVHKKRILIFSSTGGGGHGAVAKGLLKYINNDYDITVVNVFQEVLTSIDTLGTITFGKVCGEDFYNFCLRARWTNLLGGFVKSGKAFMNWRQDAMENAFFDYFKYSKPDLVISIVPIINGALLVVAQKLQIPFLVLTNDLDTTNYINALSNPTYEKFRYTLPFDDGSLHEKIAPAAINKKQLIITGFPLRPEFFVEKDTQALKREFNVPENKPVVMIFMGGAGSLASYRYTRILAKMKIPLHVIVCLGRNERLRSNIKKIALPAEMTITIIGFTDRIADLMAISDVLITKPGPGSVCEALESNVPMILDQTSGTLWWEELNVAFMVKHGFAESLTSFKELPKILPKYIKDSSRTTEIKKKMKAFKRERFDKNVKPLIQEMVQM